MSTFMANESNITPSWHVIDAKGKVLGRLATEAATLLRGKHLPTFTPHADCGDYVVVINAKDVVLTGKKLEQKKHYWHTGWIGGIKERKYKDLLEKTPERVIEYAVRGMLPHTSLGRKQFKKLRVYAGEEHDHVAQTGGAK